MKRQTLTIGVLALQGDFQEHIDMLTKCGAEALQIRWADQLDDIDGLIIPGGESTAIAKLSCDNADPIFERIKQRAKEGMAIYGTCMGSIFLAKEIEGSAQGRLALMDIKVRRNAFGPQKYSGEIELDITELGVEPYPAIFIRGPVILEANNNVQVMAKLGDSIVMARQDNMLVTAFHPELTGDTRIHQYFLDMVGAHVIVSGLERAPVLYANNCVDLNC